MKRIYIAGPMTGLPELNYPAFHAAAFRLRALGNHVENPAENLAPACGTWEGYMRMAIGQLVTCDAVHLLAGWSASKGACFEVLTAHTLGIDVVEAEPLTWPKLELVPADPSHNQRLASEQMRRNSLSAKSAWELTGPLGTNGEQRAAL